MLFINIFGLILIALIVWWFWLYQPKQTHIAGDEMIITVADGVYSPAHLQIASGQTTSLTFLRKDPSPCAQMLIIPDLDISESLPVNETKTIELPKLSAGKYPFHCQMQMYKGDITVT